MYTVMTIKTLEKLAKENNTTKQKVLDYDKNDWVKKENRIVDDLLYIKKTERLQFPKEQKKEVVDNIQTYTPYEKLSLIDKIDQQKIHVRITLLDSNNIVGARDKAYNVLSIKGNTSINKPYEYILRFLSHRKLDMSSIIDTNCKFTLKDENQRLNTKTIFAQIINIQEVTQVAKQHVYEIRAVNPFEYLKHTNKYKIYQNKTVVDIIKDVISSTSHVLNLNIVSKLDTKKLSIREYCTQYNQSDYDFILMLANEERFSLVFDDSTNDSYTIYLVDINDHHNTLAEPIYANYSIKKQFSSTNFTSNFYDYTKPSMNYKFNTGDSLQDSYIQDNDNSAQLRSELVNESIFDRLENHNNDKSNDIKRYTKLNSSSNFNNSEIITGLSHSLKTIELAHVKLIEYKTKKDMEVIILNTSINGYFPNAIDEYVSSDDEYKFNINFSATPKENIYVPLNNDIKKPRINGIQTAIVAAMQNNTKQDENTIDIDNEGKIKVLFHFDNAKPVSCYVRLGNMFSGNNWGAQFLPRVHTEVIVSFINGNIDKPVIIGSLYNGENKIPYDLPLSKTKSYIKTNSMPCDNNGANYNELLFEDKANNELLSLRAQKDYKLHALHNSNRNIDNDETQVIGHDESISIGNNKTKIIGNDETISVGNDKVEVIGANSSLNVTGNQTSTIAGNQAETTILNKAETIAIAKALSIGAGYQISVGGAKNESVGASSTEQVGSLKHMIVGDRFELNVGESSIVLNSDGTIIISGKDVTVQGSSAVTINGKSVEIN